MWFTLKGTVALARFESNKRSQSRKRARYAGVASIESLAAVISLPTSLRRTGTSALKFVDQYHRSFYMCFGARTLSPPEFSGAWVLNRHMFKYIQH